MCYLLLGGAASSSIMKRVGTFTFAVSNTSSDYIWSIGYIKRKAHCDSFNYHNKSMSYIELGGGANESNKVVGVYRISLELASGFGSWHIG